MHLIQLQHLIIAIFLKFIVITQYQEKVTCLLCLLGKNIIKIFIYPVLNLLCFRCLQCSTHLSMVTAPT